jgi:hypothetical protein
MISDSDICKIFSDIQLVFLKLDMKNKAKY